MSPALAGRFFTTNATWEAQGFSQMPLTMWMLSKCLFAEGATRQPQSPKLKVKWLRQESVYKSSLWKLECYDCFLLNFMLKINKDEVEEGNLSRILIGRGETLFGSKVWVCSFWSVCVCVCVLTSPKASFLPLSILLWGISLYKEERPYVHIWHVPLPNRASETFLFGLQGPW